MSEMLEMSNQLDRLRAQLRNLRRQRLILGSLLIVVSLIALESTQGIFRAKPVTLIKASLKASTESIHAAPGKLAYVVIYVENQSGGSWELEVADPVNLSYHLLSAGGEILDFDNVRTPLPSAVPAGTGVDVNLRIDSPKEPGEYLVEIDLVQEHVTWFKDQGNQTLTLPLIVQ